MQMVVLNKSITIPWLFVCVVIVLNISLNQVKKEGGKRKKSAPPTLINVSPETNNLFCWPYKSVIPFLDNKRSPH